MTKLKYTLLGNVYLDGTKLQANASKHKAMSYDYMKRLELELASEISKLLELACSTDEREQSLPLDLPAELQRREDRLQKIRQAKAVVEARAAERYRQEKQEFERKMSERAQKESQTGKKSPGICRSRLMPRRALRISIISPIPNRAS